MLRAKRNAPFKKKNNVQMRNCDDKKVEKNFTKIVNTIGSVPKNKFKKIDSVFNVVKFLFVLVLPINVAHLFCI
jgi:hypothetical protein